MVINNGTFSYVELTLFYEKTRRKENIMSVASKPLAPIGLLCELMENPGRAYICGKNPGFGWIVKDRSPDIIQTAYQILVASSMEALARAEGDVWDSGKVSSCESINIRYGGPALESNTVYYWKVRTWNDSANPGPYSEPQKFHTGELKEEYITERYPLVAHEVEPSQIAQKDTEHYFIDFGKAAFGTLKLILTSPDEREIEVHLGEVMTEEKSVHRNPGGTIRHREMALPIKKGTHTYAIKIPPDQRNTGKQAIKMPKEIGEVTPFRYCEIINCPCKINTSMIRQVAVNYPFNDDTSYFKSTDNILNDVWDICKYSIKATSFCGVYIDGDRERIPYEADAYINQLGHYCVDREFTMARYTHEYLITDPTWPTEWILHSVLMAWADYMYTGNVESLEEYYDDLKAKTLIALEREDGLISSRTGLVTDDVLKSIHFSGKAIRDIVDWPPASFTESEKLGEQDGYVFTNINTVVNAFHYQALFLMGRIAEVLNKGHDRSYFHERSELVKRSINEKLLDKGRGIYVDGEGTEHAALHANMFPLVFGLVPENYRPSVVDFVKSRGMACSVYGSQYLLEALYHAGEDEYALELMTSRTDRGWWHMIELGSTITLEAWDLKYKGNMDWNHAWGAAPANIIPRWLMGIRPLKPGFSKILIQPRPGTLTEADMVLPTIRGPVTARFDNHQAKPLVLEVEIPANTTACVALPCKDDPATPILLDDKPVSHRLEGGFAIVDPVGSGRHVITSE